MSGRILSVKMKPFWRSSAEDYSGVVIPLEEAHLHSHSARIGRCEYEEVPRESHDSDGLLDGDGDDDTGKDRESESQGMLEMSAAEYSVEGLRKEVRRGGKGQWTAYERECLSIWSLRFLAGRDRVWVLIEVRVVT
jgi:hypothetical protein